jgi:hypothetical protein
MRTAGGVAWHGEGSTEMAEVVVLRPESGKEEEDANVVVAIGGSGRGRGQLRAFIVCG